LTNPLASETLAGITPERYLGIQDGYKARFGHALSGYEGTLEDEHVVFFYSYNRVAQTLTLQILSVPTIFGHDVINPQTVLQKINAAISSIQ